MAAECLCSFSLLPQLTSLSLTLTGSLRDEISEETISAEIGQCVSLRHLSLSGFLHPSLSLAVTDRMHQLEDLTFTHTPGDRYSADTLAWLRQPPNLRSLSVLMLNIGLPLASFVSVLAETLSPDGPIRSLLFLPVPPFSLRVEELTAALSRLIARAPSIDRIAFEPYRYRPISASEIVAFVTSECRIIQSRRATSLYTWKGLQEAQAEHLRDMRRIVALDPQRICIAPVSKLQSALERMDQMRQRYAQ